jgi:hypothetical protein
MYPHTHAIFAAQELTAKQKDFAAFMKSAQDKSKSRFGLHEMITFVFFGVFFLQISAYKCVRSVPMQRILKYALLLKDLIKHTSAAHPDAADLPQALRTVVVRWHCCCCCCWWWRMSTAGTCTQLLCVVLLQDLAKFVNVVKGDYESMVVLTELAESIKDYSGAAPLVEYGKCLLDGQVKLQVRGKKTGVVFFVGFCV